MQAHVLSEVEKLIFYVASPNFDGKRRGQGKWQMRNYY